MTSGDAARFLRIRAGRGTAEDRACSASPRNSAAAARKISAWRWLAISRPCRMCGAVLRPERKLPVGAVERRRRGRGTTVRARSPRGGTGQCRPRAACRPSATDATSELSRRLAECAGPARGRGRDHEHPFWLGGQSLFLPAARRIDRRSPMRRRSSMRCARSPPPRRTCRHRHRRNRYLVPGPPVAGSTTTGYLGGDPDGATVYLGEGQRTRHGGSALPRPEFARRWRGLRHGRARRRRQPAAHGRRAGGAGPRPRRSA